MPESKYYNAATNRATKTLNVLLKKGLVKDINEINKKTNSTLMSIADKKHLMSADLKNAEILLNNGIDYNLRNKSGLNAMDIALNNGNWKVAELILGSYLKESIIDNSVGSNNIKYNMNCSTDLSMDTLDVLYVYKDLSKKFNINIDESFNVNALTVNDIYSVVKLKVLEKHFQKTK